MSNKQSADDGAKVVSSVDGNSHCGAALNTDKADEDELSTFIPSAMQSAIRLGSDPDYTSPESAFRLSVQAGSDPDYL